MNLKYYLRGLGIGIVMTAIILGIGSKEETLSDEQIKQRAAQLGMVEHSGLLSEREDEPVDEKVQEPTEVPEMTEEPEATKEPETTEEPEPTEETEATKEPETTEEPKATVEPEATKEPEATEKPEPTAEPEKTEEPEATEMPETEENVETPSGETVSISVNPGDGSYIVCKRLEEAGLIASAAAYDKYMSDNGYDKKLQVGTFEIEQGSSPEDIAMILMKRK